LHPSLPNYLWLEAGQHFGIFDDNPPSVHHLTTRSHLSTQLEAAGVSWKAYQENISGTTCPLVSSGLYAVKHNPFVYFDDVTDGGNPTSAHCIAHVRPYSQFESDLQQNQVARYNFITPNLCHDMHDCSVATGDAWLSTEVPKILGSAAYQHGVLFITFDESESGDGPIALIAVSPFVRPGYSNSLSYTHSSTLRTLQQIFGVTPFLGDAANAADLSDLFGPAERTDKSARQKLTVMRTQFYRRDGRSACGKLTRNFRVVATLSDHPAPERVAHTDCDGVNAIITSPENMKKLEYYGCCTCPTSTPISNGIVYAVTSYGRCGGPPGYCRRSGWCCTSVRVSRSRWPAEPSASHACRRGTAGRRR
jgi:hypothetical protein